MWLSWCLISLILSCWATIVILNFRVCSLEYVHHIYVPWRFRRRSWNIQNFPQIHPLPSSTLLTVHIEFTSFFCSVSRVEIDIYVSAATVIYLVFVDFC